MRKIFFSCLVILLLCFSVKAQEYDYCAGAGGAAASCDNSTDYIGTKSTAGSSSTPAQARMHLFPWVATMEACASGTLDTAYLQVTTAVDDKSCSLCIYTRANNDSPPTVTTTDAKVACANISVASTGLISSAFASGSVTKDALYWTAVTCNTGSASIDRDNVAMTCNTGYVIYGSEPDTLGTGWGTASYSGSFTAWGTIK